MSTASDSAADRDHPLDGWQPIATGPRDDSGVLVALIEGQTIRRVSDARNRGLGWYTFGGQACHWATHWKPLFAARVAALEAENTKLRQAQEDARRTWERIQHLEAENRQLRDENAWCRERMEAIG